MSFCYVNFASCVFFCPSVFSHKFAGIVSAIATNPPVGHPKMSFQGFAPKKQKKNVLRDHDLPRFLL